MSEPLRDNAHILSAQQDFSDAYARARQHFAGIEGVAGVGFGLKEVGGNNSDHIAIVVFVNEKKQDDEVPPEQRIPPVFEGYRTDVRVVGRGSAEACENVTEYDKIQGGIQIMGKSDNGSYQGTLGCIVKRRHDRGRENVYLLTNKHVLYSQRFGAGEHVYHPTPTDENLGPVQDGALYGNFPFPVCVPTAETYFIDCAIARIDLDSTCCGSTCSKDTTEVSETLIVDLQVNGVNSLSDVRSVIDDVTIIHTAANPRKVFKVGRTTGRTTGKVVLVGAALSADPEPDKTGGPRIAAKNTIMIEFDVASSPNGLNCKGNARFTEVGDSGSIVVDEEGRVIGLHTHRGDPSPSGVVPSHACHILPILDHLGICIPVTTGTSHGTSGAADGSGVEPSVKGDFVIPDGDIVFTAQTARAALSPKPGFPDRTPLADDELRHMRALLDALRDTGEGRELHDLFGQLRREVGYLIRNCRPVTVVWHRNKGPAFMAHVLNHLKGRTDHIPLEVDGVAATTLLDRMAAVLSLHGSNPLRQAIEQHRDGLLRMVAGGGCVSVHDIVDQLRHHATS